MYSVVEISGHQYKVQVGDLIDVQKLVADEGSNVDFDQVLFVGGETPLVGKPVVAGAKVTVRVIRHDRSKKMIVFKRKKGLYKRKNGHRQHYTALLVTEIQDGQGKADKIDSKHRWAEKYLGKKEK